MFLVKKTKVKLLYEIPDEIKNDYEEDDWTSYIGFKYKGEYYNLNGFIYSDKLKEYVYATTYFTGILISKIEYGIDDYVYVCFI